MEDLSVPDTLTAAPEIKQELFPWAAAGTRPDWLYEEIEMIRAREQSHFVHSILFSNGWEARLPFREVHLATAYPTFPLPRPPQPVAPASAPQSA